MLGERAVEEVQAIAVRHQHAKGFLFLGRGIEYPVALEGALEVEGDQLRARRGLRRRAR